MPAVVRQLPRGVFPLLLLVFLAVATPALGEADGARLPAAGAPLTLAEALARTLRQHPDLTAFSEEIRAREAETLQAGVRPNPVLSLEAENVFGSGEFAGTQGAETTLAVHQPLELGSKRSLRRHLAEAERGVAESDFQRVKADLLARTTDSFITVLAAQERLQLALEQAALAKQVLATAEERIAAGRGATTEAIRPRLQWRQQELARDRARRDLAAGRSLLAARMGEEAVDFEAVTGDLFHLPPLPEPVELERLLAGSPSIVRQIAESESRRRATRLEEARRIPDVEVGLGVRYLRESEDTALVLGLSVPLPLFDRNQGAIAAAHRRLTQARAVERSALLEAQAAVDAVWEEMNAVRAEAEVLRDEILPASRQGLEAATYGYRAGKFGILEVLDAQRTLMEAQEQHLEILTAFHRAAVEMERLLGQPLFSVDQPYLLRSEAP